MPKSVDPQLLAFLVCEKVLHDVRSNNKSFIGVFNVLGAVNVPVIQPELNVVVTLTGCHGEKKIRLELAFDDVDEEKKLIKVEGVLKAPDPLAVVDLIFDFRGIKFEKWGKYTLRLISEDSQNLIAYRYLQVNKVSMPDGTPGMGS